MMTAPYGRGQKLTRLLRRVDIVLMAAPQRLLTGAFTVETYHRLGELGVFHEDDRVELINGQVVPLTPIGDAHAACVQRDRKSTRLNSSHSQISYAVFCLKKKKHKHPLSDAAC